MIAITLRAVFSALVACFAVTLILWLFTDQTSHILPVVVMVLASTSMWSFVAIHWHNHRISYGTPAFRDYDDIYDPRRAHARYRSQLAANARR